ncbi:MAG: polyribonucleotide nucleotidyltransferase [Candidatus Taylorbacteria bacterium RIFCSPHIGHO2_02_FULL_44_36]|uniref:Polyribonucleotide nucleotidyltransferase n=1 Tax=Candidatus Taylorbacteria bacterium RIFCSPLOWO2_12_FULL_44_15c TaxID=1802333 RepID=A0A1G2P6M3_9BACT|nr:MAG: polyribonucleotide nucleotidyltransferase [Candidatus Taylorbacteria bacterium RIFCSPHIGHO2_02_FULL_44_36]OHA37952.1 MAG: polyribonucleotide nucleotidyltransferase [Candidatus Taylorbacteria bacterium RIFCSPLOWO2_02_FULL_44_35]OHA43369.1 MAG: polyribonucleotide nucleotidyltransferase [Candidatus Taylorbacteria bacterium RIFCSPLOWO2_12_FULL_44_15c]
MKTKEYALEVGGKKLTAEFTDLADQANGSVIVRLGNTTVLVTAVIGKYEKDADYFPLTVDYEERFYAAGQILGSRFMRREGRPSDEAVLSGRVVDRTIRPLFNQELRQEVQVVVTILSIAEDDPDIPAIIGASLALGASDIPWNGPVSAVRIGVLEDEKNFLVNPTYETRNAGENKLDLLACGKDGAINMIEIGAKEVAEGVIVKALETASEEIEKIQSWQKKIIKEIGKEKLTIAESQPSAELVRLFETEIDKKLFDAIFSGPGKHQIYNLKEGWLKVFAEKLPDEKLALADFYFEEKINELVHREAIENERRPDGRKMDELRPLFAKAGGVSPILHGSGIFYRGGTHILSALTLGGPGDTQIVEGMEVQTKRRFIHHYNFPPFSSGETGKVGGMNRRAIGHGALAEKALSAVIPDKEKFPYTIRIVSEALASNGSTSMGSVCGSTLALMDAGVPIKTPVAGIASGLMLSFDYAKDKKYKVLTDIQGPEDHHGDMDFKVAGTDNGVTAVQMDVKVNGIPIKILGEAFEAAKKARRQILEVIKKEISAPRSDISPNAPKIISIKIKPEQIGSIIGTGGKTINEIMEKTGAEIDIEDDGTVFFTGKNGSAEAAQKIVEEMTHEYKPGEKYEGSVTRLMDFGAFVKIGPNAEGMVHISEIAPFRIDQISSALQEGDIVPVMVKEIDEKGRINLSIKAADPSFAEKKGIKPGTGMGGGGGFGGGFRSQGGRPERRRRY